LIELKTLPFEGKIKNIKLAKHQRSKLKRGRKDGTMTNDNAIINIRLIN
jgi:hypothetical protein